MKSAPGLEIRIGSCRDREFFRRALDGCATVYHLAASVGVRLITSEPAACLRNNIEGVENLLAGVAGQTPLPRILLFSSSEVYGKSDRVPLSEEADFVLGPTAVPRWSYASGKIVGEFLALAEHRLSGLPVTIVRCFNTCGPRQRATYGMVVPRVLDQALRGEPIPDYRHGPQSPGFTFGEEVVGGVLRLAETPSAVGEVFNLGTERETTILDLAERIVAATGSSSAIRFLPYAEAYGARFEDIPRRVPDVTKLERFTGFRPATDLDELLRITLAARRNGDDSRCDHVAGAEAGAREGL